MNSRDVRRLLTRHFIRRFVDNDLLSAHADKHDTLVLGAAALLASGTFLTALLGLKYILGFSTPGWVAAEMMEDRYFLITAAMIVVALATALQWDALSLDA